MNIKLKKFNTLFTLLGLLSIGSLSANFKLGTVTVDTTQSASAITLKKDPTFADLYAAIQFDSNIKNVLIDKNNKPIKTLYYSGKAYAINDTTTLAKLNIKQNTPIKLTTTAPKVEEDKTKKDNTDPTNTNNNNNNGNGGDNDDDKKGLWKNHKKKIIGGASAAALAFAGIAGYLILNSGEESETKTA